MVTSELTLEHFNKKRRVSEKIRSIAQAPNGKSKPIGYLELRHYLQKNSQNLVIEKLDTHHEAFHGIVKGTFLKISPL